MEISDHSKVSLIWVPGHRDIVENYVADDLARAGTVLTASSILQGIGTPIASINLDIIRAFYRDAQSRWLLDTNGQEEN